MAWAEGYRMPCLTGRPIEAVWTFVYLFQGQALTTFKDVPLPVFVRSVKGIRNQRLQFDINSMGCPFEVKLAYLQPHLPNIVWEIETNNAERQKLLEWMTRQTLELPERDQAAVHGDTLIVKVPCGSLDLDGATKTQATKE
ncbi:MAG: hypothetical protein HC853_17465 [Anaerolineae bacterium]|nr:hypothetical protein [Anaerolineae bacterium]